MRMLNRQESQRNSDEHEPDLFAAQSPFPREMWWV
jgi:hypothetical protein